MSAVAPRLVEILKDIHAEAVDHIGALQKKQKDLGFARQSHQVTTAALTMYKAQIGSEEHPILDSLLEKSASMGEKLEGLAKDIEEQLADMHKGLNELTEDLRTVDPDFGKDLGPELPFTN